MVKDSAEAVKAVAETFKGAKVIRWLAQRGLCPIWLYEKSLKRQIEVAEVTAALEKKVLEHENEIKRLEMRTQSALDIERKQLKASGEVIVRESTKQLTSILKKDNNLGYNALGLLPLEGRAAYSFIESAMNQQANYEAIGLKAIKASLENNNSNETAESPSKDFETLFWNNAKNFSDTRIQDIFAAILSNEINTPGAVSPRALSLISVMSKHELEVIQDFNQYVFNNFFIIVFHSKHKFGVIDGRIEPFDTSLMPTSNENLGYLRGLGVLNYDSLGTCKQYTIEPNNGIKLYYCGKTYLLKNPIEQVKYLCFLELLPPYWEIVKYLPQKFNSDYFEKIKTALLTEGFLWEEVQN